MRVVGISDIHGILPVIPECDLVCICGDIIPLNIQTNYELSIKWLVTDFYNWCKNINCKTIILIAGNHDFVFETLQNKYNPNTIDHILWNNDKIIYLQDCACIIDNKKIYGTPWCPDLKNWAFYSENINEKFINIPDCDILITHTPPKINNSGVVLQKGINCTGCDFGCGELTNTLQSKNISWNLCGHIHSGDHNITKLNNTNIVNVSLLDEHYKINYNPYIFEL